MRVLLLSISPNQSGNRQRTDYLADALRMMGHETHIVRWKAWRQLTEKNEHASDDLTIQILPTFARLMSSKTPIWNQTLAWHKIKEIVRKLKIDVIFCPNNWYVIGYPPQQFEVPIIIDYFDLLNDEMEKKYLLNGRTVLCTSMELQQRALRWTPNAHWIPTPIDVSKFNYSNNQAKQLIGISPNTIVISLIGLTASPKLYFIDAIDQIQLTNVKCLLIGDGELFEPIKKKISEVNHPERFEMLGKISYFDVPKYFCASDIGMYPGDDEDYYHCACPIKVLEYTAAGAQVISNDLRELRNWSFPNVHLAKPTPDDFCMSIEKAIVTHGKLGDLNKFSLKAVTSQLDEVLYSVIKKSPVINGL
ncbi:glycosyltransferase [Paenibacillus filicis]|uniref:Glycosyltransferase n=1 Tax=Paenibacillus gyeongsangnamensis TaxID=3388067 RepID=A0ABT4QII3_9BACL|nr:glycosyltransferase [Paenibacillus filicis]MCZ8516490.1 glycosyltransferase [Paenibacillus filicis]